VWITECMLKPQADSAAASPQLRPRPSFLDSKSKKVSLWPPFHHLVCTLCLWDGSHQKQTASQWQPVLPARLCIAQLKLVATNVCCANFESLPSLLAVTMSLRHDGNLHAFCGTAAATGPFGLNCSLPCVHHKDLSCVTQFCTCNCTQTASQHRGGASVQHCGELQCPATEWHGIASDPGGQHIECIEAMMWHCMRLHDDPDTVQAIIIYHDHSIMEHMACAQPADATYCSSSFTRQIILQSFL